MHPLRQRQSASSRSYVTTSLMWQMLQAVGTAACMKACEAPGPCMPELWSIQDAHHLEQHFEGSFCTTCACSHACFGWSQPSWQLLTAATKLCLCRALRTYCRDPQQSSWKPAPHRHFQAELLVAEAAPLPYLSLSRALPACSISKHGKLSPGKGPKCMKQSELSRAFSIMSLM